MLRSLPLFSRWGRRSTLLYADSIRVHCSPPSLQHAPDSAWQRFMGWLLAPAPTEMAPPLNRLPGVKTEFLAAVTDIDGEAAEELRWKIQDAHSLRALWHLRADVYHLVGLHCSESEAAERLLMLNRHFPARAPRSQFAPL